MYMTLSDRLQLLLIENNVLAWSVMIDRHCAVVSKKTEKELALLNRAGGTVFSVRGSAYHAWEKWEKRS